MDKRWNVLQAPPAEVEQLLNHLRIPEILATLLIQRGISSPEAAALYFNPAPENLHSPWLMKDMDIAVTRILKAISDNQRILVYGDYDVDGTTAVACMYRFLRQRHPNVEFYIPDRYLEGYGISEEGIKWAAEQGVNLIIALDCGIKSVDRIAEAAALGMDCIICDHHLPDEILPPAVAILNPKQPDCRYPYKELCGCGVGYKLIAALAEKLGLPPESANDYLDLVAVAIAADIVPLTGENRILTALGLKKINTYPCAGLHALMKIGNAHPPMRVNQLVFIVAPRINAAGRMDHGRTAVELFATTDEKKALELASQLQDQNVLRKEADGNTTREALEMLQSNADMALKATTVLYQPHWPKGVVGIVASRLIDHYYRPTVILTLSGDVLAGSARSVIGFNLYEAIHACREHLVGYGGHYAAAGMTMKPEQLPFFIEKFEEVVTASIQPGSLHPEICIDGELSFKDINPKLFRKLMEMEPFGPENQTPVFISRNVKDTGQSRVVKEQHLRVVLRQGDTIITGIGFGLADKYPLLKGPVDIVFTLEENTWNNIKTLQLRVVDLKPTE